ncbi:MAG: PhnD/SsuA/transferrin family substrate-binding protein, partial [Deltaproteobacteria bacterium]|nr:PhnD/SsuA/transferrin family substrate-binding protein [Deltaproteobacteria bacterium]
MEDSTFSFGLPPSLGKQPVFDMAREFADVLFAARFTSVVPYKSYEALQKALFDGEIDAAWGPPVICARVEAAGGVIAQRAIRRGSTTYRSALVNRKQDRWDLSVVKTGGFRPRAVWVDEWSMGGYLLARALLKKEGIDVKEQLLNERWLGSYTQCFDSLAEYDGDITASFVGGGSLEAIWGTKVERLQILALSDESPNDGIVLAPKLDDKRILRLLENLTQLLDNRAAHEVLCTQFSV